MGLQPEKTDIELGLKIEEYFQRLGISTPMIENFQKDPEIISKIGDNFKSIMHLLGLDLTDDSLQSTPQRVAKMFVNEFFWGLFPENFPRIMTVENKMKYDEMVIEKNIKVVSVCEHHFVQIIGNCHIGYIPNGKVIGLSKLNRIVEYFSRRPQIQERLTEQIYYALSKILGTEDIGVVIQADHFCVKCRGVEDINSTTLTSKVGGNFKEFIELRQEFMSLIK